MAYQLRKRLREQANQLFVQHPAVGQWGYALLRATRLDRSTRGVVPFLEGLKQRGLAARSIVDVGANYGAWSCLARSVYPAASFCLIEPQAEMKPFLERFCAGTAGAHWIQAGAGSINGQLTLTVWKDLAGSTFLPPEGQAGVNQRQVNVVTLDSLIEGGDIPVPDLVKIDVQGAELEVLKGSRLCFGHTEAFIVEVSFFRSRSDRPVFLDVAEYLDQQGYVVYDFAGLKHRPLDGALGQADVCFARRDGVLTRHRRWA